LHGFFIVFNPVIGSKQEFTLVLDIGKCPCAFADFD